jgi:hypothetical protein
VIQSKKEEEVAKGREKGKAILWQCVIKEYTKILTEANSAKLDHC